MTPSSPRSRRCEPAIHQRSGRQRKRHCGTISKRLFEKGEFEGPPLKNPLSTRDRRRDNGLFKQFLRKIKYCWRRWLPGALDRSCCAVGLQDPPGDGILSPYETDSAEKWGPPTFLIVPLNT